MDRQLPPQGMPQLYEIVQGLWLPRGEPTRNLVMYDWATAVTQLLAGNNEYRISTMYFEFRNMDDPDEAISAPTYGRGDGIGYYEGLSDSEDTDYLRVPITSAIVTIGTEPGDATHFPNGNVVTAYAQTSGTTGVHGKTFSDSVNSKVFGGALVAAPDPDDSSRDLIISRFYLADAKQIVKLASNQIGFGWPLAQR